MVAALFDKEVVNHEILVLTGRQGIYKTTWLNNLLSPELRRYFYLKSNARRITKDDLLTLAEFAIVCLEELDEMDTQEVNQIKALTTMKAVNERAAYAHYKEHRDHIASFCGTSNNTHFLADPTGNRRWLPFEVENIDSPYDFPVDYSGVYSQAYALLQKGYHYWLENYEIEALNLHNRHFEIPCMEQELILTHYRRPMPGEKCMFITNSQILCRINSGIRQKLSPVKIGMVLKQEGFESMRAGNKQGYRMVELTVMRYKLTSTLWEDIRKSLRVRSLTTVKVCCKFPELTFTITELTFRIPKPDITRPGFSHPTFSHQLNIRLSQCLNNQPHLCRCICPHPVRRNQCMEFMPQGGMEIYPLVQFTKSGLRTKGRTIELSEFCPPISTYFKNLHIF